MSSPNVFQQRLTDAQITEYQEMAFAALNAADGLLHEQLTSADPAVDAQNTALAVRNHLKLATETVTKLAEYGRLLSRTLYSPTNLVAATPLGPAQVISAPSIESFFTEDLADVEIGVKLEPGAKMPKYSRDGDAALDLFACISEDVVIYPGERAVVSSGATFDWPKGWKGLVYSRSGLSVHRGVEVGAGLIDNNYRDVLHIVLHNFGDSDFVISPGDKIAQLLVERQIRAKLVPVSSVSQTNRGAERFGSSDRQES